MKRGSRGLCGAVLAVLALSVAAAADDRSPAPPADIEVTYDISFAGIPLGVLALSASVQGKDYHALSTLETEGFVNAFWRVKIEATTNGVLDGGQLEPALYHAVSQHGTEVQQVTVTYPASGPPSFVAVPKYKDERRIAMSDELKRNTLDPVSAMVTLATSVSSNEQKPCGQSFPVFDSRRRYDIALSYVKTSKVNVARGLYSGPAEVCAIAYRPLAGPKQRIMDVSRTPRMYAWLTPVRDPADASRQYLIPLRIWVETNFGNGAATISQVKFNGNKIAKLH